MFAARVRGVWRKLAGSEPARVLAKQMCSATTTGFTPLKSESDPNSSCYKQESQKCSIQKLSEEMKHDFTVVKHKVELCLRTVFCVCVCVFLDVGAIHFLFIAHMLEHN